MTTGPEDFSGSDYPDPFPKGATSADPRGSYTLPARLRRIIAEQRQKLEASLVARLDALGSCDDYEFAKEYGVELIGEDALAVSNRPLCLLHIRPDKASGAWLVHTSLHERYAYDEEISAVFAGPSFDELQEGDWVRIASVNCGSTHEGFFVDRSAEFFALVTNARTGNGVLRREGRTADWVITAHKPLRQVVEEMIEKHDCKDTLDVVPVPHCDGQPTFYNVHCDHFDITLAPDERTALLAAKAALEVMIARAKSKP